MRNECKLQNHPILISLIIYALITINHLIPLIRSNSQDFGSIDNGSFVIFNIIVIYSILPLSKLLTIFLSFLISATNLMILAYFMINSQLNYLIILKRVSLAFSF
jgi:hypothetical protein